MPTSREGVTADDSAVAAGGARLDGGGAVKSRRVSTPGSMLSNLRNPRASAARRSTPRHLYFCPLLTPSRSLVRADPPRRRRSATTCATPPDAERGTLRVRLDEKPRSASRTAAQCPALAVPRAATAGQLTFAAFWSGRPKAPTVCKRNNSRCVAPQEPPCFA